MSKIARKTMSIFGVNAGANEIGKFGSFAAGAPLYSTDPEVIQSLSQWLEGWYSAVVGNKSPAIQDMNALFYVICYQLAYLMQTAGAEWDDGTTYYIGSIVNDGNGNLFVSKTNDNLNNALTSLTNWKCMSDRSFTTVTTTYTILSTDDFIRANPAAGVSFVSTLPAVASTRVGKRYTYKNVANNGTNTTLSGNGAELIDFDNQITLESGQSVSVVNNGTSWDIE